MEKQHFQLCCKSKPLWAGAGVPDPGREIHDDHLKNLGKTMVFLSCRGNIRGAATRSLLTPGSRSRLRKDLIKPMGNSISSYAAKAVRQSTIEANHT